MTIEPLLQDTVDYTAIVRLQRAYADVINRRAWPELAELFRPDARVSLDLVTSGPLELIGPSEVGTFISAAIERFSFFEFVILSARQWVDGSDEATGRLYMCEIRQEEASSARSQAFGVYHDRFRRVDGRWWFAARRHHSLARTSASGDGTLDVFDFPVL